VSTGLLFIGILALAKGVLALPFSAYATFVIEERFGFNRTTMRTFVVDLLKAVGLAVALGAPVLAAVLVFFERAGDWAWLACWGVGAVFVLVVQLLLPTWILPLFNRFEPLAEGELRAALAGYVRSVGFGLGGIFVIDGSRRSTRSNAFFTGFGRSKRIALFDTLVEKHSVRELVAVLAHEVGHYKRGHVIKGMTLAIAHLGALFFLLSIFLEHRGLFEAFFMTHEPVYAGLVFFGLLLAPAELILSPALNYLSRRFEYEADRFAARTTDGPESIVSALKKLSSGNLSNLTPHPLYVVLHHSHPPLASRIERVRRAAA
jgi:STE24 endopeptidase